MRIVLVTALLLVVGFAGCIGDDAAVDTDNTVVDVQAKYKQADPDTEPPKRAFEPKMILEAEFLELEQGDIVNFTMDITDMHDYEYPHTFIDWNLTYSREPNPVAEGDATQLPATWNRTLYAEDFHFFTFQADDGQGFTANKTIVITVGDPPIPESGVIEDGGDTGGGGSAVFEPMAIDKTIPIDGTCSVACTFSLTWTGFSNSVSYAACPGLDTRTNGLGCAWVEIPPGAVGSAFTIDAVTTPGSPASGGDPDGAALDACRPNARVITTYGAVGGEAGEILPGTGCLVAWSFDEPVGDIIFHVDEFQHAVSGHIPYDVEPLAGEADTPPLTGCSGDVLGIASGLSPVKTSCPGLMTGPYGGVYDGWWIPLDTRHEGATIVTDIAQGDLKGEGLDSDCFFLDHMLNVVGNGNNGGGPCTGTVPPGTYWLYVYPYGHGTTWPGITVSIELDAAIASAAEELGRPVGSTLMEGYEDKGSHWLNLETGICYVKETSYTAAVPGVHYVAFGTWFWQEANGIPGLQVSPDDVGAETYAGAPGGLDGCTGGDITVL